MTPEGMAMYMAMSLSSQGKEANVLDSIVGGVLAVVLLVMGYFVVAALAKIVKDGVTT